MKKTIVALLVSVVCSISIAADYESIDLNPMLSEFKVVKAPETKSLLLNKGDKLAICGDSITEQKMYSVIIETYLTVCEPDLAIKVRQYGWGGETAPGFRDRMNNDCLRFDPDIATTCYGMNDHRYVPYTDEIGKEYYDSMSEIVKRFTDNGTKVVLGSPGCVGKKPWWQGDPKITTEALNKNLLKLRNMDVEIANKYGAAFADVYMPMYTAMFQAIIRYGTDFKVAGDDGVHPDWAGHTIMAYSFLTAMGLDGEIGTIIFDLANGQAAAGDGHKVLSSDNGSVTIESTRYPFCDKGAPDQFNSGRAGMNLVPFNEKLNRFILKVSNTTAKSYKVIWGDKEMVYSANQLSSGVNLAADFVENPFTKPFEEVSNAVRKKQDYETKQIKDLFHGPEGSVDMEAVVEISEKARKPLVDAITASFKPVKHTIRVVAVN